MKEAARRQFDQGTGASAPACHPSNGVFSYLRRVQGDCILNIKNKSHSVTAEVVVPKGGASGVIAINWVQIDLGKDTHDHLVSVEDRFKVAMARQ